MEEEAQIKIPAAFKGCFGEFANAQSRVQMRLAKRLSQFAKRQQALNPLLFRQSGESPQDPRINGKRLLQSFSLGPEAF